MSTLPKLTSSNGSAVRALGKSGRRLLAGLAASAAFSLSSPAFATTVTSAVDVSPADRHLDANERTVLAFYTAGLVRKDYAAAAKYLGPVYVQHHPDAKDGKSGFQEFVAYLRSQAPQSTFNYKQVFSSGDFVILHILYKPRPADRGDAVVDIFRLARGKIVEHWDVIQPVPAKFANPNTMF